MQQIAAGQNNIRSEVKEEEEKETEKVECGLEVEIEIDEVQETQWNAGGEEEEPKVNLKIIEQQLCEKIEANKSIRLEQNIIKIR